MTAPCQKAKLLILLHRPKTWSKLKLKPVKLTLKPVKFVISNFLLDKQKLINFDYFYTSLSTGFYHDT